MPQSRSAAFGGDTDRDDIDAKIGSVPPLGQQIPPRRPAQSLPLSGRDRLLGMAEIAATPGLDLDKNDLAAFFSNEVEFF